MGNWDYDPIMICKKNTSPWFFAGFFFEKKYNASYTGIITGQFVPGLNSHYFPYNRDGHHPNSKGLYTY